MNELTRLRAELDEVDRRLIADAARRSEIVRRIASAKLDAGQTRPLFDRERERAVYERAAAVAAELGFPLTTARRLMDVLIDASHTIQETVSRERALEVGSEGHAKTFPESRSRRFLILGGRGRMGQLLTRELTARGHHIDIYDVGDPRPRAEAIARAEIVLVAVPMGVARQVIEEVAPLVPAHALLCDINSLKQEVCSAMATHCRCEALGLHPMFGPTVHSLRKQKIVACQVIPAGEAGSLSRWLRDELGRMGAEVIESDPSRHDRMMAIVQVLVHFSTIVMGRALTDSGVTVEESLQFTSPIYRLELAFVGRLFAQDPHLYAQIEMSNPHGSEIRRLFRNAAEDIDRLIATGDQQAFARTFEEISSYFHGFADEAMRLSDFIIDSVVSQP